MSGIEDMYNNGGYDYSEIENKRYITFEDSAFTNRGIQEKKEDYSKDYNKESVQEYNKKVDNLMKSNNQYDENRRDRVNYNNRRQADKKGCWSYFAGSVGGLWATRELTQKEDREVYVRTSLRELVIYIIFLGVLCIITFAMTTYTMFFYTRVVGDIFIETPYADTRNNLKGSTQVMDVWRWFQTVFLDGIYWEYWYDQEKRVINEGERNILYENRLLGVPRLRQIRVRNDSCTIPYAMQKKMQKCYAEYSPESEDTEPFGPMTPNLQWVYRTPAETGSSGSWAKIKAYEGGGYVVDLLPTKNQSKVLIDQLRENLWIDRATRVVFVDFAVYNPSLNLFCVIKVNIEFPPMGGIIPSWSFRTVKLLRYVTPLDYFVMACELVFLFFVFYYIVEEALEIGKLRKAYFKSIWNILDLIVIGLSVVYVGYNIYNYITVESMLEKLLVDPDAYMNFEPIGYWQVQFNSIVAVCVFFSWFKLFKYISFNKTMTQLSSTLSRCAKDVAGFGVMFLIVFFAFSQLGYLLFGPQVFDFHTFIDSVFTLLRTILGDFNFREIEGANRILGPIFFLSYVFFVFFILLNMFLAIINDTYSEVKADIALRANEFEIGDFFKRGYNSVVGKFGMRDRFFYIMNAIKTAPRDPDGNVYYEGLRQSLKRNNFSEGEVEMLFAKYDVDGSSYLDRQEVAMMLNDLASEAQADEDGHEHRPVSARSTQQITSAGVTEEEMEMLLKRVDRLDNGVNSIDYKINAVLAKIETIELPKYKK